MWELFSLIVRYLHQRKKTIPIILLGIVLLAYVLFTLFITPPGKSDRSPEPTANPAITVTPTEKTTPSSPYPRGGIQKKNTDESSPSLSTQPFTPAEDAQLERMSNAENIRNFTRFHEFLRLGLSEQYGERFSSNLAARISENLSAGSTSMEILDQTIREELGASATDAAVQEIRAHISEALEKVAKQ